MHVLLINSNRFRDPQPVVPIGLCSVASALQAAGHTTHALDLSFSLRPDKEIADTIAKQPPDLVGVGIRNIDTAAGFKPRFLIDAVNRDVIEPLKRCYMGKIVIGGGAVGINGVELLDYLGVDFAVRGDGETAILGLADRLTNAKPFDGSPGLVWRGPDGVAHDAEPTFAAQVDELAWARPHRHLNLTPYRVYGSPIPLQTKRGCALKCTYCTYNRIEGVGYRLRNPEKIAAEIEEIVQTTGYNRIEFVDSTFNAPLDHAKAVLRAVIDRRLKLRLSTMGLNPRFIDDELIGLMKKAGFTEICLGVESGCDITLQSLGKNFTVADIAAAAKIIRRAHIPAMWFLLLGAPGETAQTVKTTFDTISRLMGFADIANIGVGIRVYKDAPVAICMETEHPGSTLAGLLKPVSYEPPAIDIATLKLLASEATITHHNFLMFDQGANILLPFRLFFTLFFPRQPIWRGYIAVRLWEKITGAWLVRLMIFRWMKRRRRAA
jgi:hypothetical protein